MCGIQVLIRQCIMMIDDNERPEYLFQCIREHDQSTVFRCGKGTRLSHGYFDTK